MTVHLIRDLDRLHRTLMSMCTRVEELIHAALGRFGKTTADDVARVDQADDTIDVLDVEIEEHCLKILALHKPVATDLRRITAVLRISAELERVADLAVAISRCGLALPGHPGLGVPSGLLSMAQIALDMLHQSIDSYVELDPVAGRYVRERDIEVDERSEAIKTHLLERLRTTPELADPLVQLVMATHHVARIADHATNIAEDVIYLVEGDIVRHTDRKPRVS